MYFWEYNLSRTLVWKINWNKVKCQKCFENCLDEQCPKSNYPGYHTVNDDMKKDVCDFELLTINKIQDDISNEVALRMQFGENIKGKKSEITQKKSSVKTLVSNETKKKISFYF